MCIVPENSSAVSDGFKDSCPACVAKKTRPSFSDGLWLNNLSAAYFSALAAEAASAAAVSSLLNHFS